MRGITTHLDGAVKRARDSGPVLGYTPDAVNQASARQVKEALENLGAQYRANRTKGNLPLLPPGVRADRIESLDPS